MKTKILTILLLAASVAMVGCDSNNRTIELMMKREDASNKFYYLAGRIEATQDTVLRDSLREEFKIYFDRLQIINRELLRGSK